MTSLEKCFDHGFDAHYTTSDSSKYKRIIHDIEIITALALQDFRAFPPSSFCAAAYLSTLTCILFVSLFLRIGMHEQWAPTGSNASPLFMNGVHLGTRLTDQKMSMMGGGLVVFGVMNGPPFFCGLLHRAESLGPYLSSEVPHLIICFVPRRSRCSAASEMLMCLPHDAVLLAWIEGLNALL